MPACGPCKASARARGAVFVPDAFGISAELKWHSRLHPSAAAPRYKGRKELSVKMLPRAKQMLSCALPSWGLKWG